ncbi:MAG: hypothetical protein OEV76_04905, partial [Anaerolineae bacterium]|nr:hypothetical protein [Anaerolineae bacterium]
RQGNAAIANAPRDSDPDESADSNYSAKPRTAASGHQGATGAGRVAIAVAHLDADRHSDIDAYPGSHGRKRYSDRRSGSGGRGHGEPADLRTRG